MDSWLTFWKYFYASWLEPLSVIFGVAAIFPVLWILYEVRLGQKRRIKVWQKEVKNACGTRPAILIVDLKPNADISVQIQKAINANQKLKSIPPGNRIFRINRSNMLTPEDMPELVVELRDKIGEIMKAGVDTVYLFYAGPVTPMAVIGSEFANCCRAFLFQHYQGDYINWGPIKYI